MSDINKIIKAWKIFRDSNPYGLCCGREFRAMNDPEYCLGQMIEDTLTILNKYAEKGIDKHVDHKIDFTDKDLMAAKDYLESKLTEEFGLYVSRKTEQIINEGACRVRHAFNSGYELGYKNAIEASEYKPDKKNETVLIGEEYEDCFGNKFVVTYYDDDNIHVIESSGASCVLNRNVFIENYAKTGAHLDVYKILNALKSNSDGESL